MPIRLYILGSSSKAWTTMRSDFFDSRAYNIYEFHTSEVFGDNTEISKISFAPDDLILIFSLSKNYFDNILTIKRINYLCASAKIFYISSLSVPATQLARTFRYCNIKRELEVYALSKSIRLLRLANVLPVHYSYNQSRCFRVVTTSLDLINCLDQDAIPPLNDLFHLNRFYSLNVFEYIYYNLYVSMFLKVPRLLPFLRPIDFALKSFKSRAYGYNLLINYMFD